MGLDTTNGLRAQVAIWVAIIALISATAVALVGTIPAFLSYRMSVEARAKLTSIEETGEESHQIMNSRYDELRDELKAAREENKKMTAEVAAMVAELAAEKKP